MHNYYIYTIIGSILLIYLSIFIIHRSLCCITWVHACCSCQHQYIQFYIYMYIYICVNVIREIWWKWEMIKKWEWWKDKQNIFIIYVTFLISCSLIGWHNINICNKIWRLQLTYLYYIVHINVICTHTNMNTTNNVTTVTILLWAILNRGLRGTWGID